MTCRQLPLPQIHSTELAASPSRMTGHPLPEVASIRVRVIEANQVGGLQNESESWKLRTSYQGHTSMPNFGS